MIVRVDEEVLVLMMNGWCALVVRFDEAVLVLTSLAITVRLFFFCNMLRGERSRSLIARGESTKPAQSFKKPTQP